MEVLFFVQQRAVKLKRPLLGTEEEDKRALQSCDVTCDPHIFVSEQNGNLLSDRGSAPGRRWKNTS